MQRVQGGNPIKVKERSRLEPTSASIALRLLLERDLGSKAFSEKICAPLKVVEVWSQLMKKRYGPVCTLSPAFARLLTWLQCYDGLQLAAATMASGAPLHGTCDSNPGIAECRAMIKEFDRCRAGGLPPPSRIPTEKELEEQAKAAKQAQEEAYAARQKAEEAEAAAAREEELAQGWLAAAVSPAPQASQQRPAVDTAEEALKNDLAKVKFFGTPDALVAALAEPLSVCCRAAILIAAPTSGWAAISMYMQTAADLQGAYKAGTGGGAGQHRLRIVVFTGGRLDIIAKVQEKARVLFPNRAAFLTFLQRTQSQTWQSRPSIAVTLLEKQDCNPNIPSTINVPRASPAQVALEGLALRCKAQECPLQAGRSGAEEGLMVEIDPEDSGWLACGPHAFLPGLVVLQGSGVQPRFLRPSPRRLGPRARGLGRAGRASKFHAKAPSRQTFQAPGAEARDRIGWALEGHAHVPTPTNLPDASAPEQPAAIEDGGLEPQALLAGKGRG